MNQIYWWFINNEWLCTYAWDKETLNYVMKDFNLSYNDVLESFKRLYTYDKRVKGKICLTTLPKRSIDHAFIKPSTNEESLKVI